MKRIWSILLAAALIAAACSGCAGRKDSSSDASAQKGGKSVAQATTEMKKFTAPVTFEDYGVEFCLPEDHNGTSFTDCGLNCVVQFDRYDADVVAYHEYDKEGETLQKTVGAYTFDYQAFDYLGEKDWRMYVIRIAFTESANQLEHRYFRFLYNVYGENYPDSQVEEFMKTIRFLD